MKTPFYSYCFTLNIILVILVNSTGLTNASEKVKKDVEDEDVPDDGKDMENMEIPVDTEIKNITCARRSNSRMHEIQTASYKQFPFVAALISSSYEYVCTGSMVANGLILTSAECSTSATYALINTTTAKKDSTSVVLNVIKTEKFPTNDKDVALLHTKKVNSSMLSIINISNISRSEDIIDVEAIGFGLNADVGNLKELQYVGLEVGEANLKNQAFLTCIDTKVLSCFKDKGGPLLVDNQLVGIINSGQLECTAEMTSKYDLSKPMIKFTHAFVFKAWLNDIIAKNKDDPNLFDSYKRSRNRDAEHMLTSGGVIQKMSLSVFLIYIFFNVL